MTLIQDYAAGLFSILGTFSKGVAGSCSINFGLSGGRNCWTGCRHHPKHPNAAENIADMCYAFGIEGRADRSQLASKLGRHEELPASTIVGRALVELEREELHGKTPRPWYRFSTNGAMPDRKRAGSDRRFLPLLRRLLVHANNRSGRGRVHLPVESAAKATFYRSAVGDLATVRESLQTADMSPDTIAHHDIPAGPVSFTAGERVQAGPNKRLRVLAAARDAAAAWAKRTGRKTIVCPAVTVSFLSRLKAYRRGRSADQVKTWRNGAKCGSCRACALECFDIVYPAQGVAAPK
jgi:hypothetical protein